MSERKISVSISVSVEADFGAATAAGDIELWCSGESLDPLANLILHRMLIYYYSYVFGFTFVRQKKSCMHLLFD